MTPFNTTPVDIIRAMVIVWRIRGKINRTVLCCVRQLCTSTHTREEFLHLTLGLGLGLVFVHFFQFSILYVFLV